MGLEILTLGSSKTYTRESLLGGGAVVGKNVTISSITPIEGGNKVTFSYTLDNGTVKTSTMDVMDGKDGVDGTNGTNGKDGQPGKDGTDAIGISKIEKIGTVDLVDTYRITFTDNTSFYYDVTNGKDGKEPSITIGTNNNWFVNGVDTGVKAIGEKGETGSGFKITRQYTSVSDMMSDTSPANDSEVVVVISDDLGTFYLRLSSYIDPNGETDGYLPIGNAQDISTIQGEPGQDGTDGITPHIDETTKHWIIGTQDTGILAEGKDGSDGLNGITPTIDSVTKHWFIGDTDTGILAQGKDGVDGKSITSVTRDENENIIVTFSDGTSQNIGKLAIDVSADFLTSGGFGNLRYYNNTFQYYNKSTSTWVDIEATTDNKLVVDLSPQPMQKMNLFVDVDNQCYKIVFKEPQDTVVDGQLLVAVEGIKFVRKLGSAPTDVDDGTLVLDYKRREFGSYTHKTYLDTNFTPNNGENWYYKAFPYSTNGFISDSSANVSSRTFKDYYLYGFQINQSESDPASMITYLEDCDNAYYEPAHMDYSTDSFNYGDWSDVWFIKNLKPCMLKYDGTVGYELDKNDYSKKVDGTASDIANTSYGGNAMVGIPKVYWKVVKVSTNVAKIYFSNKKVDSNFKCWSHIDNNGKEIDYCYMPIYNGSVISSKLRSLSGRTPMANQTATTEITYAKANNTSSDIIWYTELFNDRMLINLLLLLIGKSTDTQTIFGTGNNNSYVSASNTGIKNTGTMNTKGLFWGKQDNKSGVKVFGIEHWYGNIWRRIGGWINDKGTQKIKMTYGQSDGSTTDGYNETGSGYISIGGATPSGTSGGYISKKLITDNGLIPTIASGSATTYYCDGLWFNNSQVDYAFVGGESASVSRVGALSSALDNAPSLAAWGVGAALSCKPLATT